MPTIYVFEQNCENYQNFLFEKFYFMVVKFSVYLNRHVFIMIITNFVVASSVLVYKEGRLHCKLRQEHIQLCYIPLCI